MTDTTDSHDFNDNLNLLNPLNYPEQCHAYDPVLIEVYGVDEPVVVTLHELDTAVHSNDLEGVLKVKEMQ